MAQVVSDSLLASAFDNAVDGMIIISDNAQIITANVAACTLFEYSIDELIGQNISMLMPNPHASQHDQYVNNYTTTGTKKIIGIGREVSGKTKSGRVFPFRLSISENYSEGKRYFTGVIHDISELTQAIESLKESEERFYSIINTAVDGIITIDDRGNIETMNPASSALFGYTPEEVISKNISILMPEPFRHQHNDYIDRYKSTHKPAIIGIGREVLGLRKNGTTFPFNLSVSEVRLPNRVIFTGIIHDLSEEFEAKEKLRKLNLELEKRVKDRTKELAELVNKLERTNTSLHKEIKERTKAEQALIESQQLYTAIARNFPNGTIKVLDKDLKYVFVQGKELYDLGVHAEKMIGVSILDGLDASLIDVVESALRKVFGGESASLEIEHKEQYFVLQVVPLPSKDLTVDRILVVERNITTQKNAEKEIIRSLEKEKELNELKSRFVSMASHEFRTPLSTILSSASLISKYTSSEDLDKREKHIHRIKTNVGNLVTILNDFLSLDKLEAGKIQAFPQEVLLQPFISEIVEELSVQAKTDQQIVTEFSGPISINVDKSMLRNVLINLLSNAIKYSNEGKSILFDIQQSESTVVFKITDSGIGIPEEEQINLFERFFRAKNVTNIQGTGLGLHIVKKYLDLMNGTISVQSSLNVGTTFVVSIPLY